MASDREAPPEDSMLRAVSSADTAPSNGHSGFPPGIGTKADTSPEHHPTSRTLRKSASKPTRRRAGSSRYAAAAITTKTTPPSWYFPNAKHMPCSRSNQRGTYAPEQRQNFISALSNCRLFPRKLLPQSGYPLMASTLPWLQRAIRCGS